MKKGTRINSAWPIHSITLRAYCTCGGAIHLTTKPGENEFVMESFADAHQGEGHEACGPKTARKARKKYEREIERELLENEL